MTTLGDLEVGEAGTVKRIQGDGGLKRRVLDMGLTRGARVQICKVAPLGDLVEILVRGYQLSLRKADAALIEVER